MKKVIALLLCVVTLLSLCACGGGSGAAASGGDYKFPDIKLGDFNYPEVKDKLTWDKINAFPIKSSEMTVEEMRQLCVDFFRFSKTVVWTPNANLHYVKNNNGSEDDIFKGNVYGGFPYIGGGGCGNVYRAMDYYDTETGVMDVERAAKTIALFGNHCSSAAFAGWGRVINSAKYGYTMSMTHFNGFLRVGPYTYDDMNISFAKQTNTTAICEQNGMDTMFESYAQLHLGDGLVNYLQSGGHVIMVSSEPTVVYDADGKINGGESYFTMIEQHQVWEDMENEAGDKFLAEKSVDKKVTFLNMYNSSYLPFTFAEFLGTNPVEETEVTSSLTGDQVTVNQLLTSNVTANYGISDVYAIVKDKKGNEVYRHVSRADSAGQLNLSFRPDGDTIDSWGTLDVSKGEFTVEIQAQLSTGERPTVYTGKLVP